MLSDTDAAPLTDTEFLALVRAMRESAIGMETDQNLLSDRKTALEYSKGQMNDLPSLKNRSKAVSTDVNDAIETALPDLVEIFTGGDDVASFIPENEEDEDQAQLEMDYVKHVVFQENNGFMSIYALIKDALQQKVGVACVRWEKCVDEYTDVRKGRTAADIMQAQAKGEEISSVEAEKDDDGKPVIDPIGGPLYRYTVEKKDDRSHVEVAPVPPEHFTVASDTVQLSKTNYCAMLSYPRAQDLIAEGVERKVVDAIPGFIAPAKDNGTAQARDTAGESTAVPSQGDNLPKDHRVVEIVDHYVRVLSENEKELELWRVRTSGDSEVFIDKERVPRICFAAGTPYPVTHRFYGRSLADLLIEVQRIKTALLRMLLDSGYFALNQRHEVDMSKAGDFTLSDLQNNIPSMPVRSKEGGAVLPIPSPGLGFDALGAMEFMSTVAEARTGIVRNAQGLNPDTLHDTAKGAMALMVNAQKRLRLIARILAETAIKDIFLLVHAALRENATQSRKVKLGNQWHDIDPRQWPDRQDMHIEVGLGAAGQEHDMLTMSQVEQTAIALGGTAYGPTLVTAENAYNIAKTKFRKLGIKNPDEFVTKPPEVDPNAPPPPPPPDPHMAKVQADAQLGQQKLQADQKAQAMKMQGDAQTAQQKFAMDQMKAESDAQIEREKNAAQIQLQREIAAEELQLKREQYAAELVLKRWEIEQELQLKAAGIVADTHVAMDRNAQVNVGGEPG